MEGLRAWVQDKFNPVVLVAATPGAEAICTSKNGLSIVDILRPFSHVPRLDVSIRIGDELIKFQELKLRLHAINTLYQPKPEALEQHLHGVLQAAAQKHANMEPHAGLAEAAKSGAVQISNLSDLSPWFTEYSAEFMRVTGWGEQAMTDHPVAAILVAPADVSEPVKYFEALLNGLPLPPLMQQEVMYSIRDREFPRHYVLLLDASAPMADEKRAADNLATLRKWYGDSSASLLKINTGTGERVGQGATPDFYRQFQHACIPGGGGAGEPESRPAEPPQGLGACLSVDDLDAVAACVRGFATQLLLPRLEERVAKLNAAITATRKGLRNRFTRLWKGAADEANSDKPFLWHSGESQVRQLADLAFLLGAYAFANEMYRLAAQDYQAAGNHRWYAAAQEMRALSIIMAPNDSDPQKYFARAYEAYCKVPGPAVRLLATRTALLSSRFQQAVGRYLAASVMLMKPHQEEESARAAVLLEQSAYCLLFLKPPSIRKFAFHMVLAGLRYNAAGLKRLGLHAYRQVLGIYQGKQWRAIEEHLHDVLGRLCREAGADHKAVTHFLALLQDVGQGRSQAAQAHYLQQFTQTVKQAVPKEAAPGSLPSLPGLQLPFIDKQDVRVQFADTGCCGTPLAATLPDSSWAPLEVACSGDANVMRDIATSAIKQQTKEHEEYNLSAAGEAVSLAVRLRNTLGTKLKVSQLRLVCEFTPQDAQHQPMAVPLITTAPVDPRPSSSNTSEGGEEGGESAGGLGPLGGGDGDEGSDGGAAAGGAGGISGRLSGGGGGALHPLAGAGGAAGAGDAWIKDKSPYLHQHAVRLTLHAGEVVTEHLSVTPLAAGWLRIKGVAWLLNDTVEGWLDWEPRGRKRKHAKGPRVSQQKHFPPSRRLLFNVAPAMCRLQLVHDAMPAHMHTGEMRRVVLTVRNAGSLPCRNLQLAINQPEVACAGCSCPPSTATTSTSSVTTTTTTNNNNNNSTAFGSAAAAPGNTGGIAADWSTDVIQPVVLPKSMQNSGAFVYRPLPADQQLAPGQEMQWVVWVHPRGAGALTVQLVWFCEPCNQASSGPGAFKLRTLRTAHVIHVTPVLNLRPMIGPVPGDLTAHVLRLELEAAKGDQDVSIHQITALTAPGNDPGWQLRDESATARQQQPTATSDTPTATSRTVYPQLRLTSSPATSVALTLLPPAALPQPSPAAGDEGSSPAAALAVNCPGACPPGVLAHWYSGTQIGGSGRAGGGGMGSSRTASVASLSRSTPDGASSGPAPAPSTTTTTTTTTASGPLHSDPPIDVVVVWILPAPPPAAGDLLTFSNPATPTAASGAAGDVLAAGAAQQQGQQAPRMGIVSILDVTGSKRPPMLPLRSKLVLVSHNGQPVIRHDFRQEGMCLVDLQLGVRNCTGSQLHLEVEAGEDWRSSSQQQHAWSITSPPSLLSPSPSGYPSPSLSASITAGSPAGYPPGTPGGGSLPQTPGGELRSLGGAPPPGLAPPPAGGLSYQAGLQPGTTYTWCGRTRATHLTFPPGATWKVPLRLAVFRPGTYSITGCRLLYSKGSASDGRMVTTVEPIMLRVDVA